MHFYGWKYCLHPELRLSSHFMPQMGQSNDKNNCFALAIFLMEAESRQYLQRRCNFSAELIRNNHRRTAVFKTTPSRQEGAIFQRLIPPSQRRG